MLAHIPPRNPGWGCLGLIEGRILPTTLLKYKQGAKILAWYKKAKPYPFLDLYLAQLEPRNSFMDSLSAPIDTIFNNDLSDERNALNIAIRKQKYGDMFCDSFANARTYEKKEQMLDVLAALRTEKSIKTLIQGMESNLVLVDAAHKQSLRYEILEKLSELAHDDSVLENFNGTVSYFASHTYTDELYCVSHAFTDFNNYYHKSAAYKVGDTITCLYPLDYSPLKSVIHHINESCQKNWGTGFDEGKIVEPYFTSTPLTRETLHYW